MKLVKRKFVKIIGFSIFSTILLPFTLLKPSEKKIINPNLKRTKRYNV